MCVPGARCEFGLGLAAAEVHVMRRRLGIGMSARRQAVDVDQQVVMAGIRLVDPGRGHAHAARVRSGP